MIHGTLFAALALVAPLQEWNNLGGNARRNGFAQPLAPLSAPRVAIDAAGRVYVCNG